MTKPRQYECLKWTLLAVCLVAVAVSSWCVYDTNEDGIFLPEYAPYVTFVSVSLVCVLLLGAVAALTNSVVLLTSFGVLMGIVFVMSLVAIVGAIVFLLLTTRISSISFYPFIPPVVLTICFYFLTMIPLALKDVIRRMDVRDGGEYDPDYDRPMSPPIVLN